MHSTSSLFSISFEHLSNIFTWHSLHLGQLLFAFVFQSEVEETLKRIQSHRGVIGVIVVNSEGINEHLTFIYQFDLKSVLTMPFVIFANFRKDFYGITCSHVQPLIC